MTVNEFIETLEARLLNYILLNVDMVEDDPNNYLNTVKAKQDT